MSNYHQKDYKYAICASKKFLIHARNAVKVYDFHCQCKKLVSRTYMLYQYVVQKQSGAANISTITFHKSQSIQPSATPTINYYNVGTYSSFIKHFLSRCQNNLINKQINRFRSCLAWISTPTFCQQVAKKIININKLRFRSLQNISTIYLNIIVFLPLSLITQVWQNVCYFTI